MSDHTEKLRIVNGMVQARQRGHGRVGAFLEYAGVPRSTAYRWKQEVDWWLAEGPQEVERLRRELDETRRAFERSAAGVAFGDLREPARERAFVVTAAVLGNSDTEVAHLLALGGGRRLSHQTIHRIVEEASARARRAFEGHFAGVGEVAAADEVFLGQRPLLLMVEPRSLLISGAVLAERRRAEDWEPVFAAMEALERVVADRGQGIAAGAKEAGVERGADLWHLLARARRWLGSFETACYRKLESAYADGSKAKACEAALGEFDLLKALFGRIRGAFDYTTPKGRLNTVGRARGMVEEALAAMGQTERGRRLAVELCGLRDPRAFAHLEVLDAGLARLGLEHVGPDRKATLARLVAETVAWRRHDKTPVHELAQASSGSLADRVELAVLGVVDLAVRSSSAVEGVNARVRLVQVARKRLSEDFIYLLAVYHNMKPFGRGSIRAGRTPAQLAGVELPTEDWLALLDLTAKAPGRPVVQAA
jgi:hypothetical protein